MTSFFGVGGNPFATVVGQKIEQATDGSLASENWTLNMEICDLINETEDGPKDAIKAIRKRLQQSVGKNYTIVMFTLTVLETCVKNCGKRFHLLVCNKEFISELVKIIGPKNEPPTAVQEKVLSLIQSWADAFHAQPELSGVAQTYQELRAKGIQFPMTDLDAMAPIHTPRKSVKETLEEGTVVTTGNCAVDGGPILSLSSEQLSKLRADLDLLQTNMTVFGEMLNEMSPGNEHPADLQLFQELNSTLVEMQERLVELISKLSNDEVTADLLRINDHLNNLFLRYSRYEKNREACEGVTAARGQNGDDSLIDLTEEAAGPVAQVASHISAMSIGSQLSNLSSVSAQSGGVTLPGPTSSPQKEDKEFDMLAQSRNLVQPTPNKDSGSSYESNRKPDQISGSLGAAAEARAAQGPPSMQESDFDEMAAWLEGGGDKGFLTSSEFERFLSERAAAADRLPSANSSSDQPMTSREKSNSHLPRSNVKASEFLSNRPWAHTPPATPTNSRGGGDGKDPQEGSLFAL